MPAINAPLSGAEGLGIAVDNSGNYYIADAGNLMVMRVGHDGIVDVIAGNGVFFTSGDGGLAVNAAVFQPTSVAADSSGNVYIAEYGSGVRKVTPDGIISTFAGTGKDGFAGDNGQASQALLDAPLGLAVDPNGTVYIADTYNNRIRKVASNGIITTVAGNGNLGSTGDGGNALVAEVYQPTRIAVDAAGNIYFTEPINPSILPEVRKVDIHGIISKVAGGGFDPSDGISATKAGILPLAVAVDGAGNLYIVDNFRMGIRKVDRKGIITTVAGGAGKFGFAGDGGLAINAQFAFEAFPSIAVDSTGNIYVDDEANEGVRRITPGGIINTVAGNGRFRLSGDGGPAASATLDYPLSVTGDQAGNLYVSEQLQNRIRRIAPDGTISIYAGNGQQGLSGDGGPASSASIAFPSYLSRSRPTDSYSFPTLSTGEFAASTATATSTPMRAEADARTQAMEARRIKLDYARPWESTSIRPAISSLPSPNPTASGWYWRLPMSELEPWRAATRPVIPAMMAQRIKPH